MHRFLPENTYKGAHTQKPYRTTNIFSTTSSEITKMRNISELKRTTEEIPSLAIIKTLP